MLQNDDIIVTGLQSWDIGIGSNCKDIALELSRTNRVLYVNRSLDRISLWRSRKDPQVQSRLRSIRGDEPSIQQISDNLHVLNPRVLLESINFLPPGRVYDYFNKRNNRLIAGEIGKAVDQLGFKDLVLFNDNDFVRSYYLNDLLPHKLSIYYLRDFLTIQPYFSKRKRLEEILMEKSDYVLANSQYLADYGRQYNERSYFVGQGFDHTKFDLPDFKVPDDLKSIEGPIVGYLGALTAERLDLALIEYLAAHLEECSIVLIGPEDHQFQNSTLHSLPNVYFLGARSYDLVPHYIKGFDVCINPQAVNLLTIGNYPRKIDEYLTLGKPVVATNTKGMSYFKDFVYLSEGGEEFVRNVRTAIEEDSVEKASGRKHFAESHTWANSVQEMRKATSPDAG